MEEKYLQLNIAFKAPDEIEQVAMELSRKVSREEESFFVLDGVEYFPHMTCFPGEFPERNFEKIVQELELLAKEFVPLYMEFIGNKAEGGWFGPNFNYSSEIKNLHEKIIEKINPFRENRIREKHKDPERLNKMSQLQRNNVEKYGYPNLGDLYRPHLTITKLKNEKSAKRVAEETVWDIEKFKIDTIAIFVSGEHGTCRKLIREFELGK